MKKMNDVLWGRAIERLERAKPAPVLKVVTPDHREIMASTKRLVWMRDDSQCTHVDSEGLRCSEREGLDLSAIVAFKDGGKARAANLRLRCPKHA